VLPLSKLFGNSAEFRRNLQRAVDLREAGAAIKNDVQHIKNTPL
jgi:plasmid maintenance system antidote protein VapI